MKFANIAEVAVVALAGILMFASAANAEATNRQCWSLANNVKAALASHPNASQDAWNHYRTGSDACTKGFNSFGVSQLEAAMKELGG